jgi:hypothetical protein
MHVAQNAFMLGAGTRTLPLVVVLPRKPAAIHEERGLRLLLDLVDTSTEPVECHRRLD